ncbi:unnamed protein product [Closterium sp. Naga37s-1]|nr:unnamed protein product [Closterium sp. Naga37s-1]
MRAKAVAIAKEAFEQAKDPENQKKVAVAAAKKLGKAGLNALLPGSAHVVDAVEAAKFIDENIVPLVKAELKKRADVAAAERPNPKEYTWELENRIEPLASADVDTIYRYDERIHADVLSQKPWTKDPHYFKNVRISALALLKMVVHARSGDTIEVMGIMQGKVVDGTIIVMDAFALPVEGTETRVNAQAEAYEYMVEFTQTNKRAGRLENVVGWYHSHPGYGCWLSGIDVSTQMLNQEFQEPFLAVVIDPTRTVSAGKVEIGAFRTYPKGYKPPDEPPSEYQTIPLNKIEDFGVHCKQYYSLEITYFKSSLDSHLLDLLWNKYWVNTLSSSQLLANRDYVAGQISDLAEKLEQAEGQLAHSGRIGGFLMPPQRRKEEESPLSRSTRDSTRITVEQLHGLVSQVMKDLLFNSVAAASKPGKVQLQAASSSGGEPMVEA